MIILEFIYKGSPVSVIPFHDLDYTDSGKELIKSMIKRGLVKRPENYDRYAFYPSEQGGIWRK
jgi:hypothetical protein